MSKAEACWMVQHDSGYVGSCTYIVLYTLDKYNLISDAISSGVTQLLTNLSESTLVR